MRLLTGIRLPVWILRDDEPRKGCRDDVGRDQDWGGGRPHRRRHYGQSPSHTRGLEQPEEQQRLESLQSEIRGSVKSSLERVRAVRRGRLATGHWGLFGARRVIREHGGELDVRSEPGKGTQVRIELPCAGEPGALPLEAAPRAAS